jgi:hypothetical protein
MKKLIILLAGLVSSEAFAQGVPHGIPLVARLADNGGPLSGSHDLGFALFDAPSGGSSVWTEARNGVAISERGLLYLELGR